MFDSVGWAEILVLVVAGLFILGPERLPEGAAWLGRTIRQVRDYATGARDQLRNELGPEYDDLQKPLQDLRNLRNMDPKRAVQNHLFNGDDPFGDDKGNQYPSNGSSRKGSSGRTPQRPLADNEQPPFDADTT